MRKELRKRNINELKVVYSTEEPIKLKLQNYEEKNENFNIHCSNDFYDMRG